MADLVLLSVGAAEKAPSGKLMIVHPRGTPDNTTAPEL
jgi:hypothetical protein